MQPWTSWWARLTAWWRPKPVPALGHLHFVVYTRNGCHLCSNAWNLLEQAQRRHGFRLEAIDIDTLAELKSRYGQEIPVVTVNGKLRFRGCVNRFLLERLLRAEGARIQRGQSEERR